VVGDCPIFPISTLKLLVNGLLNVLLQQLPIVNHLGNLA